MEFILWIIAVILVIAGIVRLLQRDILWGVVLIVYTDGLVEARNEARDFYGEEALLAALAAGEHGNAEAIIENVLDGLTAFHPGRLDDDVTLVVLCHGG